VPWESTVVFSKTLQRADWPETRIARGDLSEEIGRLKREPGKDLAPLHLELVEAMTRATGVAIHVYRPRSRPVDQPVDPDQEA
jgi:hypothetical protein